jgi:chromosome segregation ATPase
MAERKPPEFRFNSDDQEPDEFYREEVKDLRIEKLSQRITLISILLPCLIAVAIYLGYRDLTGRLNQGQDSGNIEVQKLSKQMEELSKKFDEKLNTFSTTLTAQDQNIDNSISGKLYPINNNIEVLNQSMKALDQNLKQTKSALTKLDKAKADKKNQEAAIAKLEADLNPLKTQFQSLTKIRADLKSVSSEIKNLAGQFTKEMQKIAENTAKFKKEYDLLQASIARQLSEKIDKAALGVELLMFKKNQGINAQEITRLVERLDSIQKQIEDMRFGSNLIRQPEELTSRKLPAAQSALTDSTGSSENKSSSNAEDTKVLEQDLPPE